ncbi:efflux transporter outer membrane subunit [Sphingobium ummariense]
MHNFVSRSLASVVAFGLLSGCTLGPNYAPPRTIEASAVAGPFQTRSASIDRTAELPNEWWRLYEDPALDAMIQAALVANTDLRAAEANLKRARAVFSETRSLRLPATTTSGGASYGRGQTSQGGAFGSGGEQFSEQAGFAASWEIDLFGRVRRAIEAARGDTAAVEAARDGVRVTVVSEVTSAYSRACALGASLEIARSSLGLAQQSYRIVSAQQHAGSASSLDLERSGTAVAQARAALSPLDGQRKVALFELAALLGKTPSEVPAAASACTKVPVPMRPIPVGDGSSLLRRRPDVRESERTLAADTARIGVAIADLYPRISLGGAASYLHADKGIVGPALSFSAGPLISWSFPNIAAARSRVRQARATAEGDLARFDGAVLNALKDVEQALSTYASDLDERQARIDARDRAEKAFRLADLRYRAGSIGYLDQIIAQRAFTDAQADLASLDLRIAADRVAVFKSLGGGWK